MGGENQGRVEAGGRRPVTFALNLKRSGPLISGGALEGTT
jgi:hypothetical protein